MNAEIARVDQEGPAGRGIAPGAKASESTYGGRRLYTGHKPIQGVVGSPVGGVVSQAPAIPRPAP